MNRRAFLASAILFGTVAHHARARAATKTVSIGWLTAQRASSLAPFLDAFRSGLAEFGYRENDNLTIDYRYGDDNLLRVAPLAAELVRKPVDLLVVQGAAVPLVYELKLSVPAVYVFSGDPVTAGFADSLAHPRGNMTGLTFMAAELNAKRLEILRDIIPDLRRVAIVANPEHPGSQIERTYSEETARKLGLNIEFHGTSTADELTGAFAAMDPHPPQAISLFADGFAIQYRQRVIDYATQHGAPVISGWPVFARSGAICSYGPKLSESYRRLAYYVDRVLKGTRPADLPIERPTNFETVVNLKTAKALGLTVPDAIIASADELIE
ncbi:ABC transporter substrate-binding protein [Bradyrhizobium jicamae]|uniref:ABC transporter substrate-binding protein n=1 Tax=Bradyrhizobium jicamae TaxID=280332 RepID=A0ABS5G061_9BRAD|nr:ABC transporter substrate-binding protein [Bradyrhizobium jicamae]MBR0801826.1 ABC transporter substrate-binding protein [Bradyrhizobium jicamae]